MHINIINNINYRNGDEKEMDNKQKCEELRKIRIQLGEELGISDKIKQTPCEFKGKCSGTCPACQAEEKILNKELLARAAIIVGATLSLTACGPVKSGGNISGDISLTKSADELSELLTDFEKENSDNNKTSDNKVDGFDDKNNTELEGDVVYIDEDNQEGVTHKGDQPKTNYENKSVEDLLTSFVEENGKN